MKNRYTKPVLGPCLIFLALVIATLILSFAAIGCASARTVTMEYIEPIPTIDELPCHPEQGGEAL